MLLLNVTNVAICTHTQLKHFCMHNARAFFSSHTLITPLLIFAKHESQLQTILCQLSKLKSLTCIPNFRPTIAKLCRLFGLLRCSTILLIEQACSLQDHLICEKNVHFPFAGCMNTTPTTT